MKKQSLKPKGNSKLDQALKTELSSIKSISQHENSRFEELDSAIDMDVLKMHDFYKTRDPILQSQSGMIGELHFQDMLRKLIYQVCEISFENEMKSKTPVWAAEKTLAMVLQPIQNEFLVAEDPTKERKSGGLIEDQEPELKGQDPWIRSKISYEVKHIYALVENTHTTTVLDHSRQNQSSLNNTFGFQRQQQKQQHSKRDLEPAPIDLNEPLDSSMNEDQMRSEKERQTKDKQDLIQAETRKRLRELKEEQLKYEMIAKDKKSKQFTYDFDGKLIPVTSVKTHKLPPANYNINSNFLEDPNKIVNPKKRVQSMIGFQPVTVKKKTPDEEKEFVKFMATAPLVLDNLNLQPGVVIRFDGKLREGPRPQTVEMSTLSTANSSLRMPRKDYFDIIKTGNLNRQSQTATLTEAKPALEKTRQFDQNGTSLSVFTMERLKRQSLQQQQERTLDGGIKVNSTKMFATLTNTIQEDDELDLLPKVEKPKVEIKAQNSPVDEFNLAISNNLNWGKDQNSQINRLMNKDSILKNHPREKDERTTTGSKKPRDRVIPTKIPGEIRDEMEVTIQLRPVTTVETKRVKL